MKIIVYFLYACVNLSGARANSQHENIHVCMFAYVICCVLVSECIMDENHHLFLERVCEFEWCEGMRIYTCVCSCVLYVCGSGVQMYNG